MGAWSQPTATEGVADGSSLRCGSARLPSESRLCNSTGVMEKFETPRHFEPGSRDSRNEPLRAIGLDLYSTAIEKSQTSAVPSRMAATSRGSFLASSLVTSAFNPCPPLLTDMRLIALTRATSYRTIFDMCQL